MSTQDTIIHLCTKRRKMKYFVHRLHEKSRIKRLIFIELLRRRITFGYLPFLRLLSRWLYHLSRHCLPVLGAKLAANFVQFFVLCVLTNSRSFWSSLGDQIRLVRVSPFEYLFLGLVLFLSDALSVIIVSSPEMRVSVVLGNVLIEVWFFCKM